MSTEIKILMLQKGIKQVDIAKKLKVSPVAVCTVIKGSRKSKRIRQAIAEALDEKVEELWPESSESISGF